MPPHSAGSQIRVSRKSVPVENRRRCTIVAASILLGYQMNPLPIPPDLRPAFRFVTRLLSILVGLMAALVLADISAQVVPPSYAGLAYVVVGVVNCMFYAWASRSIFRRVGLLPD
jgi:hypothetical protein